MTTSHSNYLPQDPLVKVLHFLPFASLLKFKRVSKEWKAIINDPKFFNRYHDKSLTLFVKNESLFCVLVRHNEDHKPAADPPCTVRRIPIIGPEGEVNGSLRLLSEPSSALACVSLDHYRFLVYNLFTGALYTVEDVPTRLRFCNGWSCYGFGYDRYADDHKLTVALEKNPTMGFKREGDIAFWIYSFRNRAWNKRPLEGFPYGAYSNWLWMYQACSLNGVLHWVFSQRGGEGKLAIVTYDLRTHRFGEMSAPPMLNSSYLSSLKLFQVGGHLCFGYNFFCFGHIDTHVWVMKEYGVKESWAKLCTIDQSSLLTMDKLRLRDDPLDGYVMTNMALCEPRDGEKIVFFWSLRNHHLIWYDVKDGSAQVVDYAASLEP